MHEHMELREINVSNYSKKEYILGFDQYQQVIESIFEELETLPKGGFLFLDFRDVRYVTCAFLENIISLFGKPGRQEIQDRYIVLYLDKINIELMKSIILLLKQKNFVIPYIDEMGNISFLGDLTKAQKDTLEIVREKKSVTSSNVSEIFGIPVTAASNRLKELYDMRLVARDEKCLTSTGGRQFVYSNIPWPENG